MHAGKEDEEEDVAEEARRPSVVPNPAAPTRQEVREHRVAEHLPFRIWNPACVKGRSTNRQHHAAKPEDE